jgi:Sulfotransferase family
MNPYVFIVGCPRSGTTLLQRMVDAHPHIAIIFETHWIPRWFEKRRGVTPEGCVTPELVDKLLKDRRFKKNLRIGRKDLDRLISSSEPVSYSSFVTGFFDLHGHAQSKPLVGDKTPAYVRRMPTLHALFPKTRFVHIIRDGRDVCQSITNWRKADEAAGRFATWEEDPVSTTALWWKWNVTLGREDGAPLGSDLYHEVRYEALVSEPANECEKLCSFLDLPYDDAMLRFHEGRERVEPGRSAKSAWLRVTPGLRDWRTQMCTGDVERFEAAAGDLLEELGYERAFPHPPEETLAWAARIRESFTRDASASGKRLPKGWER